MCFWSFLLSKVAIKVGLSYAKDPRQVTPSAVVCAKSFLQSFLSECPSGVMQTQKLLEACALVLSRSSVYLGNHDLEKTTISLKGHLQNVLRMLRDTKWEESHQSSWKRYPRSGAFRRKAMAQGVWHIIQELLDMVECIAEDVQNQTKFLLQRSSFIFFSFSWPKNDEKWWANEKVSYVIWNTLLEK